MLVATFHIQVVRGIIDGTMVTGADCPFYTAVLSIDDSNSVGFCGGSILNEHSILTAQHCLGNVMYAIPNDDSNVFDVAAHVDSINKFGHLSDTTRSYVIVEMVKYARSVQGGIFSYHHDLLMLRTEENLFWDNNFLTPIALVAHDPSPGTPIWIYGHGETEQNSGLSEELRQIQSDVAPRTSCTLSDTLTKPQDILTAPSYVPTLSIIRRDLVCVDYGDNRNTGSGDSGGPMTVIENNVQVLAGAVSFGLADYTAGTPFAGQNVYTARSWITATMNNFALTPAVNNYTGPAKWTTSN